MYSRRLKAYKSIGYTSMKGDNNIDNCGYIYDGRDFVEQFIKDLSSASREAVVSVPNISKIANPKVAHAISGCLATGVKVQIITSEESFDRGLFDLQIDVEYTSNFAIHYAVIDSQICWYGDINLLGYNAPDRIALRLYDRSIAGELIKRQ